MLASMLAYLHARMHARIRVCIHACIHAYMHTYIRTQVLGGVKEWRKEEFGIVIQEGRFNQDEYEPRLPPKFVRHREFG